MLPLIARRTGRHSPILAALGLTGAAAAYLQQDTAHAEAAPGKPAPSGALDPNAFKSFKVTSKEQLTHNTYRIRFELPENQPSGMFVASCLVTKAMLPEGDTTKAVVRPYTPVTPPDTRGHMDLVIKDYPAGKMSKHITSLKVGDTLEMKGPIPKLKYEPNMKKHIGMVAGGTGITPMLQVIDCILSNPDDKTTINLVYGNLRPNEVILKDRLDELASKHPNRFKVYYVVDKADWGGFFWTGGTGFITEDVLKKHMPPPDKDSLILVCGPPGMMDAISGNKAKDYSQGELTGALKALGYTSQQVFKF